MTPEYLYTLGENGPCLSFYAATQSKRLVWISQAFAAAHPALTLIIGTVGRSATSKWTFSPSRKHVLDVGKRRNTNGHGNEVMIFVTLAERDHQDPAAPPTGARTGACVCFQARVPSGMQACLPASLHACTCAYGCLPMQHMRTYMQLPMREQCVGQAVSEMLVAKVAYASEVAQAANTAREV